MKIENLRALEKRVSTYNPCSEENASLNERHNAALRAHYGHTTRPKKVRQIIEAFSSKLSASKLAAGIQTALNGLPPSEREKVEVEYEHWTEEIDGIGSMITVNTEVKYIVLALTRKETKDEASQRVARTKATWVAVKAQAKVRILDIEINKVREALSFCKSYEVESVPELENEIKRLTEMLATLTSDDK